MVVLTSTTYNDRGDDQVVEIVDRIGQGFFENTFYGVHGSLTLSSEGASDDLFGERYIKSNLSYSFRLYNDSLLAFYDRLTTSEDGRYFIRYTLDGQVEFTGVIQPDVGGVPLDDNSPPLLTIVAVDILTDLAGRELRNVKGDGKFYSLGEHLAQALSESNIYDELYASDDIVLTSNVPMYSSAMDEPCDPLMESATQDFIWRERDNDLNPFNYANADEMIVDICNAFNARIYCSKGRVVIENLLQRANDESGYWNYTKSDLAVNTKPVGDYIIPGQLAAELYVQKSAGGPTAVRNTYSSLHSMLPPARGIRLTKTGWGYVNLIRNYTISATATQLTGSGLTWSGIYGRDLQLTRINEIDEKKLIIDATVECYVDGRNVLSLASEYDLQVTMLIRINDQYLTNKDGVTQLFVNPESAAMLAECVWSTNANARLIYKPLESIPTRGYADAGRYEAIKIHQVRLISEEIPSTGDLHLEIEDISIINKLTGNATSLTNATTVIYRWISDSRIGIGEELADIYGDNDTTELFRLTSTANKHIYDINTRLIDYSDNPNDSRALVFRGANPPVGLTPWRDDNLVISAKLDLILLYQAIAMTRKPVRVISVEVDGNVTLDSVYRHKKRGEATYYICMPVKRTYVCDTDRTTLTAMVLNTETYTGGGVISGVGVTQLPRKIDLRLLTSSPGNVIGGSDSIYPVYFTSTVTGNEVEVLGFTLPAPADINDAIRRILVVSVAGSERHLVTTLSTDRIEQREQVTTDVSGSNNKLVFGRALSGQRVTVRLYGYISNTPPPSQ